MTTYSVGLNTGNTGSLVCVSLNKSAPTSSQVGTSSSLGSTSLAAINRMVFLASFPVSGAGTVTNARLRLANADAMAATTSVELRALVNTFVKAQATWNVRATATNWNVAGVLGGTDVTATVIGTGTTPTTITTFDITGAGLDAWVQGCIDGSITVPALIVSKLDDTTSFAAAYNRIRTDTGTDGLRPLLTFDFTPAALPNITIDDVLVSKYSGTATVTVRLSSTYASDTTVDFTTANDTATAPEYYTSVSGTVTITAGQTTGTITVPITP